MYVVMRAGRMPSTLTCPQRPQSFSFANVGAQFATLAQRYKSANQSTNLAIRTSVFVQYLLTNCVFLCSLLSLELLAYVAEQHTRTPTHSTMAASSLTAGAIDVSITHPGSRWLGFGISVSTPAGTSQPLWQMSERLHIYTPLSLVAHC
jgi:hypothetical protein